MGLAGTRPLWRAAGDYPSWPRAISIAPPPAFAIFTKPELTQATGNEQSFGIPSVLHSRRVRPRFEPALFDVQMVHDVRYRYIGLAFGQAYNILHHFVRIRIHWTDFIPAPPQPGCPEGRIVWKVACGVIVNRPFPCSFYGLECCQRLCQMPAEPWHCLLAEAFSLLSITYVKYTYFTYIYRVEGWCVCVYKHTGENDDTKKWQKGSDSSDLYENKGKRTVQRGSAMALPPSARD